MEMLSAYFSLTEFTASQTAFRLGLANTPDATELANLRRLAYTLENVRTLLGGKPILISSAFRSAAITRQSAAC
ncbi:D-Ala-D-Ala carboxypeptidase family metallohydrolase [Paraburkholderia bannensis]|uniref:D-Ala-D-Ala carboxypeptidase family metallohydrolase n=1 Tax=Paraburkholderia bannensis TaxID=765414 RepID=UPI002AC32DFB|nr:D-Ala-D-Ala carboxypeptidase family metallohydrolase [Paraburkholderia bannensis]